ncbi:MAG: response regulator [Bacteroidia bacterium]|nr:response regulator [Bacteroidia bacterium]
MKQKLNCILFIDDDEPTNFISKMLIEEANCAEHIEIAQSGQAALDFLVNNEHPAINGKGFPCPDLIFLDINMPAMNGWEFLEKYNELDQQHKGNVITVMLTTSLNPEDRMKANENPEISRFETKPLTSEKLNRILREYFPDYFLKPTG